MPRCLLLDLDGTIADSLGVARAVYERVLARLHRAGTPAEFERLNGVPMSTIAERLIAAHGLDLDAAALAADYAAEFAAAYRAVRPAPGAAELMSWARRQGWGLAIVTSAAQGLARGWLERWELPADALVTAESVSRGKPDPEPYRAALRTLDAHPGEATAVEDSRIGASAAASAGVETIVVGASDQAGWPAGVRFCADLHAVARLLQSRA